MYRVLLSNNLDINTIKNGLITKLIANKNNKDLILKVYDVNANSIDENLAYLSKFGFKFAREVYTSANVSFYQNFAMRFLTQRIAFSCFCHTNSDSIYSGKCDTLDDNQVLAKEERFCIRVKKPIPSIDIKEIDFSFSISPSDIDSFMILHEDKTPTMVFANAIDDMLLDIDMIVANSSDDTNSAREEYIRKLINYPKSITYIHIPYIIEAPSIKELFAKGILPDSIANYILNTLTNTDEIKTIQDYQDIDTKTFVKNDVHFCLDTLLTLNAKHIQNLDPLVLAKALGYFDKDIGLLAKALQYNNMVDIQNVINKIFAKKELDSFGVQIANITKSKYCDTYEEYINLLYSQLNVDIKVINKSLSDIITNAVDLATIYPYIKNYLVEVIK